MEKPETEEKAAEQTEDSKNAKKGKKIDIVDIIVDILCIGLFAFAYLSITVWMFVVQINASIKMMRFLFVLWILIGGLSVCIIEWLFWKSREKGRIKTAHATVSVLSVILAVLALFGMFRSFNKRLDPFFAQSNNAHASSYTNMPISFGEKNLESAIEKAVLKGGQEENVSDEIFRLENEDRVWVYFQGKNQVDCYEFRLEDGCYYCVGSSRTVYYYDYDFLQHNNSDTDTMRSDIFNSVNGNPYAIDAAPAWGVTENENAGLIKINSVGVDFVKEISDTDGGKYYFWLIRDGSFIKQEEIENLVIEGI